MGDTKSWSVATEKADVKYSVFVSRNLFILVIVLTQVEPPCLTLKPDHEGNLMLVLRNPKKNVFRDKLETVNFFCKRTCVLQKFFDFPHWKLLYGVNAERNSLDKTSINKLINLNLPTVK